MFVFLSCCQRLNTIVPVEIEILQYKFDGP